MARLLRPFGALENDGRSGLQSADEQDQSPQASLRRRHERLVFRAISAHDVVSRTQLASLTGLSAQSVGRVVQVLIDAGLVEETTMERGKGPGASPVGLRVPPDGAFAIGFGVERDFWSAVALDLGGGVKWRVSRPLRGDAPATAILDEMKREVWKLLNSREWSARRPRLCGVGITSPGPLDVESGTIIGPPNFPNWERVDVVKELGTAFDLPVLVDNASTAAAMAHAWRLPHGHPPFLYCYWGLGIGGGLILGDEVYRGATGNAMEIGHVVVNANGRLCECGNVGCLETEASVLSILRDASRHGAFPSLKELMQTAPTSPKVAAIITKAAEKVAAALVSVLNVVEVDEIVLGGEHLAEVQEVFVPIIRERVKNRAFRRSIAATEVTVSSIGEVANAIGAAILAFHSLLPEHFTNYRAPSRARARPPASTFS
jgi:predicted NBD/HSP70 family sugar kinase